MRMCRLLLLVPFLSLAFSPALRAQEAPEPGGPPPASTAPGRIEDDNPVATLKVQANLVNLYFSAHDKSGFLTNLHKDDCQVLEDKLPQTLKDFTQEKNLPLTIGMLLDTSGSQMNVLPLEQQAAGEFLRDVLKQKDEAFLISFDINLNLLADYTNNPRDIQRALDKAQINTGAGTGSVTGNATPKGTLLFDAVYSASHEKLRTETGRKVLILLTDGGDQGSQETLKDAIETAQKANAIVYVILIADRSFYSGGGFGINLADSGARDMAHRASETGGRVINVGNNGKKLQDAFQQLEDELRTQYFVTYRPVNLKLDGSYRKLEVTCGKGQTIQARKGYYALPGGFGGDE